MEKLNIAEILKDCPNGMELDCTMYDNVTLKEVDINNDNYPIQIETTKSGFCTRLTKYGQNVTVDEAKCVIFPKGKTTWEGFQRPFKDGDIAVSKFGDWIGIVKSLFSSSDEYEVYVAFENWGQCTIIHNNVPLRLVRLATEEEKQKLFKAIKDNNYKWNAETKTLEKLIEPRFKVGDRIKSKNINTNYLNDNHIFTITEISGGRYWSNRLAIEYIENQDDWELVPNKFDITTLKPFEKVLARLRDTDYWKPAFWGRRITNKNFPFITSFGFTAQAIPFKGNEWLVGTTNDCDEYYKTWE